jgi:hypothetical protein
MFTLNSIEASRTATSRPVKKGLNGLDAHLLEGAGEWMRITMPGSNEIKMVRQTKEKGLYLAAGVALKNNHPEAIGSPGGSSGWVK